MRRFIIPGILLLFLHLGCQTVQAPGLARTRGKVQPYDGALDAATRTAMLYSGFDRVISVSVTLLTSAFRVALDAELERLRHAEAAERIGLEVAPEGALDLIVFLDGRDPAWEDLEERASTFQVELLMADQVYPAHLLRRLDEDDATLRHLFPLTGRFGRLYRLRVDAPPPGLDGLTVRFSGGPGVLAVGF